jgi:RimJ/RimL family protein N-acetyltransferase
MHAAGRALVDGDGAGRVAERMLCFPFAFRPAAATDCDRIFAWANDPVIRSASFHNGAISRQEHEAWFARTLADPDTLFWIIMLHGDRPAGQVRFAINNGEAVISISLAAEYRHAGLGSRAISTACCRLFAMGGISVVHARIRKDNAQSVKSFSRAGFVLHSEETVQGVPALHMSLRDTR